jgi:hypothetical protein
MRRRPLIHFRSARADATDRFFHQASLNRAGTSSFGALPSTHLSCQKLVFLPSPSCITVQALNRVISDFVDGGCNPCHGFPLSVQRNQGHHRRSAVLKRSRSKMSRWPNCLGRVTLFQCTTPWPRRTLSVPCHRNRQRIRLIFFKVHLES